MPVEHLTMPVEVPDLTHLTSAELTSLRGFIGSQMRDARKKANQAISKVDSLRPLWVDTVASKPNATAEETDEILRLFHREVLRHPTAFLSYAYANSLHVLDRAIWGELLRRSK